MTTGTETSIRWACVKHLIDELRLGLPGVTVEPAWPGEQNVNKEMLWAGDIEGPVTVPVMTGGRMNRDDKFDIPLNVKVTGHLTLDATRSRLAEIVAIVETVFAVSPTIEDFPGVVAAEITFERDTAGLFPTGPIGYAQVTVSVHSRLT